MSKFIKTILDKDVDIPRLQFFIATGFKDGKLTLKGRIYVKIVTILLSLMYFVGDRTGLMALSIMGIMTLLIPIVINIITRLLRNKLNANNLEDILAYTGAYGIAILGTMMICMSGIDRLSELKPEYFVGILSPASIIVIIAGSILTIEFVASKLPGNKPGDI